MDLCHSCHAFAASFCSNLHLGKSFNAFHHVASLSGPSERSKYCRLCYLIGYHASKALHDPSWSLYNNAVVEIVAKRSSYMEHAMKGPASELRVVIKPPHSDRFVLYGAIWASSGSHAAVSDLISCDPPLPSDDSPEALALFRAWFETCRKDHDRCKRTLDGTLTDDDTGPKLPTRVLDLGEPGTRDLVLMETKGMRSNYCALSYCWGPENAQTCITTRNNIEQRFSGITFDSMPKTFQDAVQIARQISVRYIWIDGLCIVQGDTEDWERESKQMGSIYQMACLVISASGATCPEEGCFVSTPRELFSVDLPFYTSTGHHSGSFHVCIYSYEDESPYWGHLCTRGWALQESYLARRSLKFMPGGPSWGCRVNDDDTWLLNERNISYDSQQYSEWAKVVQNFSYMNLTYKTDRLMAVRGIATELEKLTGDTYNRGLFLSKIGNQLLWNNQDMAPESEDLNDVPSWSWASIGGQKGTSLWDCEMYGIDTVAEIDETKVYINAEGCLKLQSFVLECKVYDTALHDKEIFDMACFHVLLMGRSFCDMRQGILHIEGNPPQRIGITAFDRRHFDNVCCLCLMSTTMAKLSHYAQWLEPNDPEVRRVPYKGDEVVTFVLVLVSVPDRIECYRRVGMGMLIKPPEADDKSVFKTIHII